MAVLLNLQELMRSLDFLEKCSKWESISIGSIMSLNSSGLEAATFFRHPVKFGFELEGGLVRIIGGNLGLDKWG